MIILLSLIQSFNHLVVESMKPLKQYFGRMAKFFFFFFIALLIISATFTSKIIFSGYSLLEESSEFPKEDNLISFWSQFRKIFPIQKELLKGETEDRVNFLLLGIGGPGHEGAYLTDTIILVSLKPSTKQVATLSIPRDLYVSIPNHGWRRINNVYALAETNSSQGGELASQVVSNILNLPVHYWAVIDFSGFKGIIDKLGGVKINVERSFTDYNYPAPNYKYQTISFDKGWQEMDGETALKFVRSRYGTSGEGSDFARAQRQQKVLLAIKDKIFSFYTLIRPGTIVDIFREMEGSYKTNLEPWEVVRLFKLGKGIKKEEIFTKVLTNGINGPLYPEKTPDGAYILMPKNSDFTEISQIAQNIFQLAELEKEKELVKQEEAQIIIENGTKIAGLASKTAQLLELDGFKILRIANAPEQNFEETMLYDLSRGKKPFSLKYLETKLGVKASDPLPKFLFEEDSHFYQDLGTSLWSFNVPLIFKEAYQKGDFLVIVGP